LAGRAQAKCLDVAAFDNEAQRAGGIVECGANWGGGGFGHLVALAVVKQTLYVPALGKSLLMLIRNVLPAWTS
jgi:hypothetical protein